MPTPDDELLQLVELLGRVLDGELRDGRDGLQRVHLRALAYLRVANRYSNTPRALAEFLGLTKGTVSQSLLLLDRRGLVERAPDPEDGRVVRLRLSAKGRRLADGSSLEGRWAAALAGVPAGERAAAARVLRQALVALQRQRGNLSFGECRTCRHFLREGADTFRCGLTGEPLLRAETRQTCREHAWPDGVPGPA
jgi:DNA-binding MarR family transcriptional regulator